MTEPVVLCKDCVHSFRTFSDMLTHGFNSSFAYKCRKNYKNYEERINLVVGVKPVAAHYESCTITRSDYNQNSCGSQGRWWEPKHKKHYFIWLKRIGNV